MQHVAGVQLHVVDAGGFRQQQRVRRGDTRVVLRDRQQPDLPGRIAPGNHHVSDVGMYQGRLDARYDNPIVRKDTGDTYRPRETERHAREVLVGDWNDVFLFVDDDVFREAFQAVKRALSFTYPHRGGHRLVRLAAFTFAQHT